MSNLNCPLITITGMRKAGVSDEEILRILKVCLDEVPVHLEQMIRLTGLEMVGLDPKHIVTVFEAEEYNHAVAIHFATRADQ